MEWNDQHTIALIPIGLAIVVSVLVLVVGGSAGTAQWAAIIAFFGSLPFVIGRLIDRAR